MQRTRNGRCGSVLLLFALPRVRHGLGTSQRCASSKTCAAVFRSHSCQRLFDVLVSDAVFAGFGLRAFLRIRNQEVLIN